MFGLKRLFGTREPILIVSAYNYNYGPLHKISSASYRKYVSHFGGKYEYRDYVIPGEYDRPVSWFKIDLLISLCKERQGIIWWVDCDTVITKLAKLPEHNKALNLCFTTDFHGINSGVFSIRSCKATLDLLEEIRSQTPFIYHSWGEQAAIQHLYNNTENLAQYSGIYDNSIVNSFEMSLYGMKPSDIGQITSQTIVAHFPGTSFQNRLRLMEHYSI